LVDAAARGTESGGMMKTRSVMRRLVPILLLLAVIGGAFYSFFERSEEESGTLHLFGNVDIRQVQLAFHSTGRIQALHVQEGDHVRAGQLVAEVDPVRYQAAADRAEAQVAAQREVVARLLAGSRPEEITQAKALVKGAEATLRDAERNQKRIHQLASHEFVAQQQLDDADAALVRAQANLEALQQAANLAVQGPRKEDITAAQAQLHAYEAGLALAGQELADTKLFAPADGVIQNRVLEPGDMAFPQTPAYTLALNDPVWVRAYLPETDLGKICEGMAATVTTDSFPDKVYEGWIGYISPTAEFTPKQVETTDLRTRLVYQVRVFVGNHQHELRLGMPATVRIPVVPSHRAEDPQPTAARKD
jgi:HlyD family secretion protein